tara:strand:+ start:186 stop:377 length:192 start_codon:yes stop_codon:yes gene_type:complete
MMRKPQKRERQVGLLVFKIILPPPNDRHKRLRFLKEKPLRIKKPQHSKADITNTKRHSSARRE